MDQTKLKPSIKCTKHSDKNVKFIQVNEVINNQNDNIFTCSDCFNDNLQFQGINYLLISQVVQHGEENILRKWPPVADYSILEKLIHQTTIKKQSMSIVDQIQDFFAELKSEFIKKVDFCQKKMMNHALKIPQSKVDLLSRYQQISKITELRQLIMNEQSHSSQESQSICKQFVQQVESEKEKNTQLLHQLLIQSESKASLIDFKYPQLLKESIFSMIDQINFFESEIGHQNQLLNNDHQISFRKSEKIMELISNKSNFCSDAFLNEMKQKLYLLRPLFNSISFEEMHQNNKIPINFSELSEEQLNKIEKYVDHSININNSREYLSSIKNSNYVKQIQQIFECKINQVNPNFKEIFSNYLIDTHPFLKEGDNQNIITDNQQFNLVKGMDEDFIISLLKLLQKKTELQVININSSKTLQFMNEVKDTISKKFQIDEMKQIFMKFPIFDIQEPNQKKKDILNEIMLLKTNYKDSNHRIQITKNNNNQYEACINLSNYIGKYSFNDANCISNLIIQKDKKYIFRIQLQLTREGYPIVGLMSASKQNTNSGYSERLSCQFHTQNGVIEHTSDYGIDIYEKGNKLKLSKEMSVEMRVWREGGQLEVLDYPNYESKVSIDQEAKSYLINTNDLTLYFFLNIEQMKYTLTEAYIVDLFAD